MPQQDDTNWTVDSLGLSVYKVLDNEKKDKDVILFREENTLRVLCIPRQEEQRSSTYKYWRFNSRKYDKKIWLLQDVKRMCKTGKEVLWCRH